MGTLARNLSGQVQTLIEKEYPRAAGVDKNQFFKRHILPLKREVRRLPANKVRRLIHESRNGEIPILLVIPEQVVPLSKQMRMVRLNGEKGYINTKIGRFRNIDGIVTPDTPYLIFDVEDGTVALGISSFDYISQLEKQRRFPLTAVEGVALVTHFPRVLEVHNIDLPGSRCGSGDILDLSLEDGSPKLDSCKGSERVSNWGVASCIR